MGRRVLSIEILHIRPNNAPYTPKHKAGIHRKGLERKRERHVQETGGR